jgi:Holliday junction resolvase
VPSQYRRGADFERRLKKHLEALGYFVVRSAGSKGLVDLVAFGPEGVYFIQCKLTGKIKPSDLTDLGDLAMLYGAKPIMATPQNFKEIWRD